LELLGQYLFEFLFPNADDIRDKFKMDFRRLYDSQGTLLPDARLRIHLVFPRTLNDKLTNYPWELLCWNTGTDLVFLSGQKSELLLSRFVPDAEERAAQLKTNKDKLRVLLVACAPQTDAGGGRVDKVDVEQTMALLEGLEKKNLIELTAVSNVTFEELRNLLAGKGRDGSRTNGERMAVDVFHFIGHGREGAVCLMKSDKEKKEEIALRGDPFFKPAVLKECESRSFAGLFAAPQPRLVFLQACEGAADSIQGLKSVAWTLVYEHDIPAVVAMQYKINNEQALTFARAFYQHLARGRPIDEAVREGREALGQQEVGSQKAWGDRSFATPVTYLWSEKAIVEPRDESDEPPPDRVVPPVQGKVPCPNPDCKGWVLPIQKKCLRCHEFLMLCPGCQQQAILARLHECAVCGYTEASAATASAMGAVPVSAAPVPPEGPGRPLEAPSGFQVPVRDPRLSN